LRDLEKAFWGKITASVTHEIKNTYAIIQESSGLLSDLLTLQPEGSLIHKEKFQRVLDTINNQVNRGVILATRLNQFAHSMDEPWTEVKMADLLELAVSLLQRLVRRREIELKAATPEADLSIRSNPFRLLLILDSVIERLPEVLKPGGQIVLQSSPAPEGLAILLEVQGPKQAGWEGFLEQFFPSLKDFLEAVGAELAISSPPTPEGVILTIKTSGE